MKIQPRRRRRRSRWRIELPGRYIYRPYFTTKDGRKIWAKWFGHKAFRFRVVEDDVAASDADE